MYRGGVEREINVAKAWMLVFLILGIYSTLYAQHRGDVQYATVTHITSKHVYVRLTAPSAIRAGDTLWKASTPCLVVLRSSSMSCLTRALGACHLQLGDTVYYFIPSVQSMAPSSPSVRDTNGVSVDNPLQPTKKEASGTKRRRVFSLYMRHSLTDDAQYSTLTSEWRHMYSYRLALAVEHPFHLPMGLDVQLYYRHPRGYASAVSALRIHHLALHYNPRASTSIYFGRNLRAWQGDAGPIDGIAIEERFGQWTFGLTAGFHSSPLDFGWSSLHHSYGAYFKHQWRSHNIASTTSIGWIDTRYGGRLDRRYFSFAHHFIPSKTWRIRLRGTIDAPQIRNGTRIDRPYFTNAQFDMQYHPWRWLRASVGAFRRTRPLYLYSYEDLLDDFVERNTSVWGLYTRMYASWPFLRLALGYSRRIHRDGSASHYTAQITFPKVLLFHGRLSYIFTDSYSSYLRMRGHTVHYRQPLFGMRWSWQLYVRSVDYRFRRLVYTHRSWVVGTGLSIPLYAFGQLDGYVEGTQHTTYRQFRYYLRLTKRIRIQR